MPNGVLPLRIRLATVSLSSMKRAAIIITLIISFAFEGTIGHVSSINVTGSAKRDFTADIIVRQSNFSTKNMGLSDAYKKLDMDIFITGQKGRTVGCFNKDGTPKQPLTSFEKLALAKYLTVERPTNSILDSLGGLVGSVFSSVPEKDQESKGEEEKANILETLKKAGVEVQANGKLIICLLYTSPRPRD